MCLRVLTWRRKEKKRKRKKRKEVSNFVLRIYFFKYSQFLMPKGKKSSSTIPVWKVGQGAARDLESDLLMNLTVFWIWPKDAVQVKCDLKHPCHPFHGYLMMPCSNCWSVEWYGHGEKCADKLRWIPWTLDYMARTVMKLYDNWFNCRMFIAVNLLKTYNFISKYVQSNWACY